METSAKLFVCSKVSAKVAKKVIPLFKNTITLFSIEKVDNIQNLIVKLDALDTIASKIMHISLLSTVPAPLDGALDQWPPPLEIMLKAIFYAFFM